MHALYPLAAALFSVTYVTATETTIFVSNDPASWQRNEWSGQVGDKFFFILPEGTSHALAQMSFDAPCVPLKGGFNSGATQRTQTNFTIELVSEEPIYIGCGVPGHCHNAEGSTINAPITLKTQSLIDWLLKARATPEDNSSQTSLSATAEGSGAGGARVVSVAEYQPPAPSTTSTPTPKPKPPTSAYPNWVVGVAFAAAIILVAVGAGITMLGQRAAKAKEMVEMSVVKGKAKESFDKQA